jgi:lysophospholipase L1-like esterase
MLGLLLATVALLSAWSPAADALTKLRTRPAAPTPAATPSPSAVAPARTANPAPSASAAAVGPYRVVGLGDSVPAGSACSCTSYVALVGASEAARRGTRAAVTNLAQGGLTTADLLEQLEEGSVRRAVAAADLVIVTVGANDFDSSAVGDSSCSAPALSCFQPVLQQQTSQVAAALREVRQLQAAHGGRTLVTGYWNVFLDGSVAAAQGAAYVRNSVALTRAENALLAAAAAAQGATYVDVFTPFKGSGDRDDTALLAPDGDHPNAAGHGLLASTLEGAL